MFRLDNKMFQFMLKLAEHYGHEWAIALNYAPKVLEILNGIENGPTHRQIQAAIDFAYTLEDVADGGVDSPFARNEYGDLTVYHITMTGRLEWEQDSWTGGLKFKINRPNENEVLVATVDPDLNVSIAVAIKTNRGVSSWHGINQNGHHVGFPMTQVNTRSEFFQRHIDALIEPLMVLGCNVANHKAYIENFMDAVPVHPNIK